MSHLHFFSYLKGVFVGQQHLSINHLLIPNITNFNIMSLTRWLFWGMIEIIPQKVHRTIYCVYTIFKSTPQDKYVPEESFWRKMNNYKSTRSLVMIFLLMPFSLSHARDKKNENYMVGNVFLYLKSLHYLGLNVSTYVKDNPFCAIKKIL